MINLHKYDKLNTIETLRASTLQCFFFCSRLSDVGFHVSMMIWGKEALCNT